jgi:hypothetical protein
MDAILRKNHMADAAARAAPKSSNRSRRHGAAISTAVLVETRLRG